jgi:hypothetical protein
MSAAGLPTGSTADEGWRSGAWPNYASILVIPIDFMHDRPSWRPQMDAQT